MAERELVSVIVPTRNSAGVLERCLSSILNQDYREIELIVVDNHSTDRTLEIARRFTSHVFIHGPERSTQRNVGAERSRGRYLLFIDSDMELSPAVVSSCVAVAEKNSSIGGIIIPEESFGTTFWARCKALERSFYKGVDWIEAARFFRRDIFERVGGYDPELVSGEDWDLSQRVGATSRIDRVHQLIYHNEGSLRLLPHLSKRFYYGKHLSSYLKKPDHERTAGKQAGIVRRYALLLSDPLRVLKQPVVSLGMFFLKTAEFAAMGMGVLFGPKGERDEAE